MSHFTVLVVGPDVDAALYPFWELDLSEEEIQKDPRAEFEVKIGDGLLRASFFGWKDEHPKYQKEYNYQNAEAWLDGWHGYQKGPGGWGYWHNPKAKWDWYQVGGRWPDFLISKTIGPCDSTRKRDVDWEAMQKRATSGAIGSWEKAVVDPCRAWLYGLRENETEKEYVARNSGLFTFAIIKDGQWYEKGDMGWWCLVGDEKEEPEWQAIWQKVLDSVGDDEVLTLVDCHI